MGLKQLAEDLREAADAIEREHWIGTTAVEVCRFIVSLNDYAGIPDDVRVKARNVVGAINAGDPTEPEETRK